MLFWLMVISRDALFLQKMAFQSTATNRNGCVGKIAQSVKSLPCRNEDMSPVSRIQVKKYGCCDHTYNFSAGAMETGRSLGNHCSVDTSYLISYRSVENLASNKKG